MLNLVDRVPIQDLRIVVTAMLIQKESGGNLAEVLDKVATIIRDRYQLKRQIQVHTAQGRLTGWILYLSADWTRDSLMYLLNPKLVSLLWTRPIGMKMHIRLRNHDMPGWARDSQHYSHSCLRALLWESQLSLS